MLLHCRSSPQLARRAAARWPQLDSDADPSIGLSPQRESDATQTPLWSATAGQRRRADSIVADVYMFNLISCILVHQFSRHTPSCDGACGCGKKRLTHAGRQQMHRSVGTPSGPSATARGNMLSRSLSLYLCGSMFGSRAGPWLLMSSSRVATSPLRRGTVSFFNCGAVDA